jgi:hypothetical protein
MFRKVFLSNFGMIATKSASLGQTNPNLTTDGLSPIRAGIFTSIYRGLRIYFDMNFL